jgi:hypothetical protein
MSDAGTASKDAVPPGSDKTAKAAGPPAGDGDSGKGVDRSGRGGGGDWRRSFDMAVTFLTTTGTTPSSYISRTTGFTNSRLKIERIRRI